MSDSKTLKNCARFNIKFQFSKSTKCNKIIELIRRLSVNFPRMSILTIYKSFIRVYKEESISKRFFRCKLS